MQSKSLFITLAVIVGLGCTGLFVSQASQPAQAMLLPPTLQMVNTSGGARQTMEDNYPAYLPVVKKYYTSPEAGKIVFSSFRTGNYEIYSMNSNGSEVMPLTNNPGNDWAPDWSPDGSRIVFTSQISVSNGLYVMKADGSEQTRLTDLSDCYHPQWSPDGIHIVVACTSVYMNSVLYSMNSDGSNLIQLTDPSIAAREPYWSADGSKIAFIADIPPSTGIYVMKADGTDISLLYESFEVGFFAWSPDESQLALALFNATFGLHGLYTYDIDLGKLIELTDAKRNHTDVDWSPEGNYLIFSSNRDDPENYEIYTMSPDGYAVKNLTNSPQADIQPDWVK